MKPVLDVTLHAPTLGKRLRALRKKHGLTQSELGELTDLTQQKIYRYEADKERPKVTALAKLSEVLGASMEYLIVDGLPEIPEKGAYIQITNLIEKLLALKFSRPVKVPKLIQMVLFFATVCNVSTPKLGKLLFFADFLSFKDYDTAISNFPYIKTVLGPHPVSYRCLLRVLDLLNVVNIIDAEIDEDRGVILTDVIEPEFTIDKTMLKDEELATLRKISSVLGDRSNMELLQIIHNESFYNRLDKGEVIPYDIVKTVQIDSLNKMARLLT